MSSTNRTLGAVVWLLDGSDGERPLRVRHLQLENSLGLAHKHFFINEMSNYPPFVFHVEVSENITSNILAAFPRVHMVAFKHVLYTGWQNASMRNSTFGYCAKRVWHDGYLHMTTFRSFALHMHPTLSMYQYMMLLDTDTYIEKPFPFDPFERMQRGDVVFSYVQCTMESSSDCLMGLGKAAWQYLRVNNYTFSNLPGHVKDIDIRTAYVGYFSVRSLTFFKSFAYNDFMRHIQSYGGVYTHRWIDQNIWALALALLVQKEQVQRWDELDREHVVVHKSELLGGRTRLKRKQKTYRYDPINIKYPACYTSATCVCNHSSLTERMERLRHT